MSEAKNPVWIDDEIGSSHFIETLEDGSTMYTPTHNPDYSRLFMRKVHEQPPLKKLVVAMAKS